MEIWKDIKGFDGIYQVSNFGGVRRIVSKTKRLPIKTPTVLKQKTDKNGYREVHLWNRGSVRFFRVHKLVLLAFRGECPSDSRRPILMDRKITISSKTWSG